LRPGDRSFMAFPKQADLRSVLHFSFQGKEEGRMWPRAEREK